MSEERDAKRTHLERFIDRIGKQEEIVSMTMNQAALALDRARAMKNDVAGSIEKMAIPVLDKRFTYMAHELGLWMAIRFAALQELKGIYDEEDAEAGAAREAGQGERTEEPPADSQV